MSSAQVTGSTSSYARKYALNGLFCIDDTKDDDTKDNSEPTAPAKPRATKKVSFPTVQNGEWTNPDWKNLKPEHYEAVMNSASVKQKPFYQIKIDELINGKPMTATQMGQSEKIKEEKSISIDEINDEISWVKKDEAK